MARPSKNDQNQKDFLSAASDDTLAEIAAIFNVEFPEDISREDKVKLIASAKKKNTEFAQQIKLEDGVTMDCPKGHAIVQIDPPQGIEWGQVSRATFMLAVNGELCVGRRGVPVCIKEKYLEVLKNAVRIVREQSPADIGDPSRDIPWKITSRKEHAENFRVLAHNPDHDALEKAERELVAGAERRARAKLQQETLKDTLFDKLTGA